MRQIRHARLSFVKHPVVVEPHASGRRWADIEVRMDDHCLENCCHAEEMMTFVYPDQFTLQHCTVRQSRLLCPRVVDAQFALMTAPGDLVTRNTGCPSRGGRGCA